MGVGVHRDADLRVPEHLHDDPIGNTGAVGRSRAALPSALSACRTGHGKSPGPPSPSARGPRRLSPPTPRPAPCRPGGITPRRTRPSAADTRCHALPLLSASCRRRPYQDHLLDESEWCLCAIINRLRAEILNACSDASGLVWTHTGKGVRVWTVKIPVGSFRGPASGREGDHFLYGFKGARRRLPPGAGRARAGTES
jgi:hypothetical protein